MKNRISFLAAAALLLWGGHHLKAQDKRNTIDVIGTSEIVLTPDQVIIEIQVENTAKTAKEAQKATTQASARVLDYLRQVESVKKVETNYISLRPRVDYNNKMAEEYVATQSLGFILTDINDYETVIIGLIENGVNGIGRVEFTSSEKEKYEKELMARAVQNAREKASFLASQLGQATGRALHISDRVNHGGPVPVAFKSAMDMAESVSVAPGELKISAELNVIFELK